MQLESATGAGSLVLLVNNLIQILRSTYATNQFLDLFLLIFTL